MVLKVYSEFSNHRSVMYNTLLAEEIWLSYVVLSVLRSSRLS